MRHIDKWVPMSEASAATEGTIKTGTLGVPASVSDRLMLNVGVLESGLIRWGGFESATLASYDNEGEVRWAIPDAASAGNGPGAIPYTAAAEKSRSNSSFDKDLNLRKIRNGTADIGWNSSALAADLSIAQQHDVELRARQLDKTIGREAIKQVWGHNTIDVFKSGWFTSLGFLYLDIELEPFGFFVNQDGTPLTNEELATVIPLALGIKACMNALAVMFFRLSEMIKRGEEPPGSLYDPFFLSCNPTRALAATAVLSKKIVAAAGRNTIESAA